MLFSRLDRNILALAVPALGALAADPVVSLVDTAFVGRLGATDLGALGVNVAIFSFAFLVFNFLAYGTTPRVARALGRGDKAAAGRAATQAITLAVVLGVAALVFLQIFAVPVLRLMGVGETLHDPALAYLRIRALAGPALLIITAAHGIFRGFQDTRTALVVTLWFNAVNLVLDPLFIFGFAWGLAGAAWATVIAQWVGAVHFLALLLARKEEYRVPLVVPRPAELMPFLRIGWAMTVRTFSLIVTLTLATAVATRVGVVEVAAHQVAAQLWLFLALIVDALAIAGQALIARYLGAGEVATARMVANRLLLWGLFFGILLTIVFAALWQVLPRAFTTDELVIEALVSIYLFVALMQPLNALVFVWDGIFMGAEDFAYLAKAMVISSLAAVATLLLVIPFGWGLTGVWWSLVVLMLARGVTLALRYYGTRSPVPQASAP